MKRLIKPISVLCPLAVVALLLLSGCSKVNYEADRPAIFAAVNELHKRVLVLEARPVVTATATPAPAARK